MPADIDTILAAMKAALEAAYPTVPVLVKAAATTGAGKVPMPGWTAGSKVPCFVLSELDAEESDVSASFELVTLGYKVVCEYVKSGSPKNWESDPDIRQKRIELMNLFYTEGVPGMPANQFNAAYKPLPVYAGDAEDKVVVSAQIFTYTIHLPRPGVS